MRENRELDATVKVAFLFAVKGSISVRDCEVFRTVHRFCGKEQDDIQALKDAVVDLDISECQPRSSNHIVLREA